jgi:hypothetical protein
LFLWLDDGSRMIREDPVRFCEGLRVQLPRPTHPYVKVGGEWAYLYRAIDKHGDTIDFYLSPNTQAAKRFLAKSLTGLKAWEKPMVINTDKALTYTAAIAELKQEGKCPQETEHRQVRYLNNVVEADHGKLKQLIRPVRGFKTLKTAYATIKGFEVIRALRKGQAAIFNLTRDIRGEARIVERAFGVGPASSPRLCNSSASEWSSRRRDPRATSDRHAPRCRFATEPGEVEPPNGNDFGSCSGSYLKNSGLVPFAMRQSFLGSEVFHLTKPIGGGDRSAAIRR